MVGRQVNVDSLLHPFACVEPDGHVVNHSCPNGQDCLKYEEASEKRDVCFLVKQIVHGSVYCPETFVFTDSSRLLHKGFTSIKLEIAMRFSDAAVLDDFLEASFKREHAILEEVSSR